MTTTTHIASAATIAQPNTLGNLAYFPEHGCRFDITFNLEAATWKVEEVYTGGANDYRSNNYYDTYTLPKLTDASQFAWWMQENVQPLLDRIKAGTENSLPGNDAGEDAETAVDQIYDLFHKGTSIPTLDGAAEADAEIDCVRLSGAEDHLLYVRDYVRDNPPTGDED